MFYFTYFLGKKYEEQDQRIIATDEQEPSTGFQAYATLCFLIHLSQTLWQI